MEEIVKNKTSFSGKSFLIGFALALVVAVSVIGGAIADRAGGLVFLDGFAPVNGEITTEEAVKELVTEESAVVAVVENVSESVVTVAIKTPERRVLEISPFGGFRSRIQGGVQQDIGSGFIVGADGMIVTNRHVVDVPEAEYIVILSDGSEHDVVSIVKDPSNDLAIIKIDKVGLKPVSLGNSDNLKVGQFVIAIGTALGEFRHTVTTGVISGLGRGITAGSANPFEGFVERLDDVIQTDAAINPGNSGGPLLNSKGKVIGINTAVSANAENIGFALPVNLIVNGLEQFSATGNFASRPFLGVQYQMISQQAAILNDVPQGAFVLEVVPGSAAEKAGLLVDDIITKLNGENVSDSEDGLAHYIEKYEAGEEIVLTVWRDGDTLEVKATLSDG